MKYIDADKLIAELRRQKHELELSIQSQGDYGQSCHIVAYENIISLIGSLQQEQPMPDSTKLIELWHEDKEKLKEKDFRNDPWRLAYNAFLCGFGRGIAVNKPKQPEVDLEKEIERFLASEDSTTYVPSGKFTTSYKDPKKIARHFAEWGAEHFRDTTKKVSKDLEEAAKEYDETESWRYEALKYPRREAFEAGAEWQKEQMKKGNPIVMSVEDFQALIDNTIKRAEKEAREQMMKDAVYMTKCNLSLGNHTEKVLAFGDRFPNGEKVRVIIVKED